MRTFLVVWVGQLVSLIGSSLTSFALAVWVFQETGSATRLSFVLLAGAVPQLVMTPIAGALVDRWDRRWAMILSDTGAGASTLVIASLLLLDRLELWHLLVALAVSSAFQAFQWPAYSAATSLLVSKEQYGRAAGLVQLAEAIGQVIAPALAGAILVVSGLGAVIAIDVATFVFAVCTLLLVRFPRPERSAVGEAAAGRLLQEARFGWSYIMDRPGLLALLGFFAAVNLVFGFVGVLIYPLVLAFASEASFGSALSIGAVGMVLGSLLMGAWGGPKRRVLGVIGADAVLGLSLIVVGLKPSIALVAVGIFIAMFVLPIANGSSQAIWQAKVEPDIQGRVFAVRRLLAQIAGPVALIAAGPLADRVFEPLLVEGGALAGSVGSFFGVGPGRGIGFLFVILGVISIATSVAALGYGRLRNLEDEIDDWDVADGSEPPAEDPTEDGTPAIGKSV